MKVVKAVAKVALIAGAAVVGTIVAGPIGGLAFATATMAGENLLEKKAPSAAPSQQNRLLASLVADAPRKIAFGHTALAADVRYEEWWGDAQEIFSEVIQTASHYVESVDEVWLNTELAWAKSDGGDDGRGTYLGYFFCSTREQATAANTYVDNWSGRWGATARMVGCSDIYLRFRVEGLNSKATSPFSSSIPSRITIRGKGARLYDPRFDSSVGGSGTMRAGDQSTWAWSYGGVEIGRNPALQLLFWLIGWRIQNPVTGEWKLAVGRGVPIERIDLDSFMTAANLCDELVYKGDGTQEPRYRSDGVFSESDDPKQIIATFEATMNGKVRDWGGRFALQLFHDDLAAPVLDFTDDDILGAIDWDDGDQIPKNITKGKYVNATDTGLYQEVDYPAVSLASLDGIDRIDAFDTPMVQSADQSQRLAKMRLERAQYPGAMSATFNAKAWGVKDGDLVRVTCSALGFLQKPMRIDLTTVDMTGACPMRLVEENAALYAAFSDTRAPVTAAVPQTFNPLLLPIVRAIDDASKTAEWSEVVGQGKPADNATNSADPASKFGPDDTVGGAKAKVAQARQDIDALVETFGSTTTANAAKEAALAAQHAAEIAEQGAQSASGTATTQAGLAQGHAEDAGDSAAAAATYSALSASIGPGVLNQDPAMTLWTPDGSALTKWSPAGGTPIRVGGINGAPYSCRFDAAANVITGLDQRISAAAGKYIVEVTADLLSGSWDGAGIRVSWGNLSGSTYSQIGEAKLSFLTAADTASYVGNNGFRRTWLLYVDTGVNGSINVFDFYPWANYDGFGSAMSAKSVVFRAARFHPVSTGDIDAKAAITQIEQVAANLDGAIAEGIKTYAVNYNGAAITLQELAGVMATVDGRQAVIWQITEILPDGTARIALVNTKGGGTAFLVDAANAYFSGNVIVAGSVTAMQLGFGATGAVSLYVNWPAASWNRTDAWAAFAQLQLESQQGQPIEGRISFCATATESASTRIQVRVRRDDNTIVWADHSGVGTLYTVSNGGTSIAIDFSDTVPSGRSTTWYIEVVKANGDTTNVNLEAIYGRIVEETRPAYQHATINTATGTGPGAGSAGGGNVNGGGAGFGCPHEDEWLLLANETHDGPGVAIRAGDLRFGAWLWTRSEHGSDWGAYRVNYVGSTIQPLWQAPGRPVTSASHLWEIDGAWVRADMIGEPLGRDGRVVSMHVETAHTYALIGADGTPLLSHNKAVDHDYA